jgi:hypothetical protein
MRRSPPPTAHHDDLLGQGPVQAYGGACCLTAYFDKVTQLPCQPQATATGGGATARQATGQGVGQAPALGWAGQRH